MSSVDVRGDRELWGLLREAGMDDFFKILLALSQGGRHLEKLHSLLPFNRRLLLPDLKKLKDQRRIMATEECKVATSPFTGEAVNWFLSVQDDKNLYRYYLRRIKKGRRNCGRIRGKVVVPKNVLGGACDHRYFWVEILETSFMLYCFVLENGELGIYLEENIFTGLNEPKTRRLISDMPATNIQVSWRDSTIPRVDYYYEIPAGDIKQCLGESRLNTVLVDDAEAFTRALIEELNRNSLPVRSISVGDYKVTH